MRTGSLAEVSGPNVSEVTAGESSAPVGNLVKADAFLITRPAVSALVLGYSEEASISKGNLTSGLFAAPSRSLAGVILATLA